MRQLAALPPLPRLSSLSPLALASMIACLAATAHAQSGAPAPSDASRKDQVQSVTVTSGKREEAAHRVPYNVSAIEEEDLREQNITDLKKLIAQSEGISAPGNSARFADSVTVRGLNVSPVNANNIEQFVRSTLAYYLDDTLLPHIGLRIKDIARVETLLGPQGTLYGAGSLGGTVRFITHKPQFGKNAGRVSTEFYRTGGGGLSNDTDAMANLALGRDLALRVVVARLDEKGYTDRLSNPPWRTGQWAWSTKPDPSRNLYENDDYQRVDTARVALRWRLTPALEFTLTHAEQKQLAHGTSGASITPVLIANATTPAQIDAAWRLNQSPCSGAACTYTTANRLSAPFVVNDHTILSRYPEFADRRFSLDGLDIDWNLGIARLHSNTSRFKDSRIGQADYASQGNAFYNWFPAGNVRRSNNSLYMTFDNTYRGVQHETRLVSTGTGPMSWVAGVFLTRQERNWKFDEIFPGIDTLAPQGDFFGINRKSVGGTTDSGYAEDLGSRYRERAVFGEMTYALTPAWKASLGARVFSYEDQATAFIFDYAGGLADTDTRSNTKEKAQSYYKANTWYQLTPDLLGYLTYSQGFRRGGTNAFRSFPNDKQIVAPDTQAYGPDTTDNYEIGFKGFALDRQLYLQVSAYRIDWKNVQTYYAQGLPDPFGLGIDFPLNGTTNGPDARSRGLELSGRWRLDENWQLSFGSATTNARWVTTRQRCTYVANNRPGDTADPDGPDCRVWSAGGKMNGAPKWKHRLAVNYNRGLGNDTWLSANLGVRYTGAVVSDRTDSPTAATPLTYPAHKLFNSNVAVSRGAWSANLWVQNLTNVRSLISVQGLGDTIMGTRVINTTPRTLGLGLTYRFD